MDVQSKESTRAASAEAARHPPTSTPAPGGEGGHQSTLPLFLFVVAGILAAFFTGMYVQYSKIYPFPLIDSAYKTLGVHLDFWNPADAADRSVSVAECAPVAESSLEKMRGDLHMSRLICPAARVTHGEAAAARVEFIAGDELDDPVLVKGEVGAFLDHCRGSWGCAAVEYSRSGVVRRTWPLRPEDVAEANIVAETDYPYEHSLGWSFDFSYFYVSPFPNGDLLVVFQFTGSHPYGGGVAQLDPHGRPRWYRKDYSHHWPYVVDENLILVPGMRFKPARLSYPVGPGDIRELRCDRGRILGDQVNIIDGRGSLLEEIPILDAIVQSRYAGSLADVRENQYCDPIHLNFVHLLGEDVGGTAGIAPGDLVVSLRNINAFGILDRDNRQLKRLVQGTFRRQHGVRHLEKSRFLMFDNRGTDGTHGPSRLLMVDLATGKETTIFPNDYTPEHLGEWFTKFGGQFDVSADGQRVLLVDPPRGRAFEIRLLDGEILNIFHQIHSVSGLTGVPEELTKNAWIFEFNSIYYANRWEE